MSNYIIKFRADYNGVPVILEDVTISLSELSLWQNFGYLVDMFSDLDLVNMSDKILSNKFMSIDELESITNNLGFLEHDDEKWTSITKLNKMFISPEVKYEELTKGLFSRKTKGNAVLYTIEEFDKAYLNEFDEDDGHGYYVKDGIEHVEDDYSIFDTDAFIRKVATHISWYNR